MVDMIDISNYDGAVDFNAVRQAGIQTIYTHAFEFGPNEQSFPTNWSGIRQAGMQRGAYCFARPDNYTAADQATQTVDWVTSHGFDGSDFFVLDAEVAMTPDWAYEFLSTVQGRGFPIALYCSTSFLFDVLVADSRLSAYPLIVADYGPNDGGVYPISRQLPWPAWAHQYTSVGQVPGVPTNCDCNLFLDNTLNPGGMDLTPEEHDALMNLANGIPAYGVLGAGAGATKAAYELTGVGHNNVSVQQKLDQLLAKPAVALDQATINAMATAIAQAVVNALATQPKAHGTWTEQ